MGTGTVGVFGRRNELGTGTLGDNIGKEIIVGHRYCGFIGKEIRVGHRYCGCI